jgi:amino-acid N-acetyltransferase
MSFLIRPAEVGELPDVLRLLAESKLPVEGVAEHLDGFLVGEEAGNVVGVIGCERYGDVGLLRSLAVTRSARGRQWGRRLLESLMAQTRQEDLRALYLLTETAEGFFARFGFQTVPRDSLDPRLQASRELQGVCPESAVAMRMDLRRTA